MNDYEFWREIHAALLKQARDLQEQRAAVLQQASAIEKQFGFRRIATVKIESSAAANSAGVASTQEICT